MRTLIFAFPAQPPCFQSSALD